MRRMLWLCAVLVGSGSCVEQGGGDGGPPDAGPSDAGSDWSGGDGGVLDAGATDGGATDAGAVDSGTPDAGVLDAGDTVAPVLTLSPYRDRTRVFDVQLSGSVSDDRGVVSLLLFRHDAGEPVTVDADGGFTLRLAPLPGWNELQLVASDGTNTSLAVARVFYGRSIAAGASHTLYAFDGGLTVWGRNNVGQLGLASDAGFSDVAVYVPGVRDVVSVTLGNNASIALRADGTAMGFGANGTAQLGQGFLADGGADRVNRWSPVDYSLTNLVSAAAGYDHVLFLRGDGQVLAVGDNASGQLGLDGGGLSPVPVTVAGLNDIIQVIGGSQHSAALSRDGGVWVWGRNQYGNLGQGTMDTERHPTPALVPGLLPSRMLASGRDHLVALVSDGTVWTWGLGTAAQLGQGSAPAVNSATPLKVAGLDRVIEVAANGNLTFALRDDGTLWAWGQGGQGALGVGAVDGGSTAFPNQPAPVRVRVVSDVVDVAAGALHGFAIEGDGTVWAWGWNLNGTLGAGPGQLTSWPYGEAVLVVLP